MKQQAKNNGAKWQQQRGNSMAATIKSMAAISLA